MLAQGVFDYRRIVLHDSQLQGSVDEHNQRKSPRGCLYPWPLLTNTRRVTQLEQKIEDLTALVSTSQHAARVSASPISALPTPSTCCWRPYHPTDLNGSDDQTIDASPSGKGRTASIPITTPSSLQKLSALDIPVVLEEKLLSDFRTAMAQQFPFVVITPEITTAALRRESPFLFLACITVAANAEPAAQGRLAHKLLNHLSEHMLFRCEKSLDLLQGLLVFISW